MKSKRNRFLFFPPLILLLLIGIWDIVWVVISTRDYFQRMENQAEQMLLLKKNKFVLAMLTGQEEALRNEAKELRTVFASVKKVSFYLKEKSSYVGPYFVLKGLKKKWIERDTFTLMAGYPVFLDDLYVGNVYFELEDDSITTTIRMAIVFFIAALIGFLVGLFLMRKNLDLEKIVREKVSEINHQMTYIVHELKNPLTAVNNMAYILKQYGDSAKSRSLGGNIQEMVGSIESKVNYLLDLSKIDFQMMAQEKEVLKIRGFVDIYLNKLSYLIVEKDLKLQNNIDEELELEISPDLLEILLNNILSNAIKYTNSGEVRIFIKKKRKNIHIVVEDTGIGIPKEAQQKIFSLFYRTSDATETEKGTGVGLFLTKKILDVLRWGIKVESPIHQNKGSRITLIVPRKSV